MTKQRAPQSRPLLPLEVHKRLLEVVAAEVRHTLGDHPEYAANRRRALAMENSVAKRVVGALAVEFMIELRSQRGTGAID